MELTYIQKGALAELINIGCGRAAEALSELTGHQTSLEIPEIAMHPIEELRPLLVQMVEGEVATVSQAFSGPIGGNALLLLDEKAAVMLSELLTDEASSAGVFDSGAREIITEVGDVLLNACLGVFGNLLQVQVSFAVPRLRVDTIGSVLQSIEISEAE